LEVRGQKHGGWKEFIKGYMDLGGGGEASEVKVLGRIFGPKRGEVTRDWRKVHNVELHNVYTSPIKIKSSNQRG
jgi:hypothetical protein